MYKIKFFYKGAINIRKRYRYILNGVALGKDKISDFRLVAGNNMPKPYNGRIALRVNIPSNLELDKWRCDPYSTTDDNRTLDELGYDLLIWSESKGKWEIHNELKGVRPCDIPLNLRT